MKKSLFLLYLLPIILIFTLTMVSAISECGGDTPCICGDSLIASRTLNESDNLDCSAGGTGVNITSSDVTFDCDGYYLIGEGSLGGEDAGIWFNNPGLNNITIKNCNISGFSIGIVGVADNLTIFNNTLDNFFVALALSNYDYDEENCSYYTTGTHIYSNANITSNTIYGLGSSNSGYGIDIGCFSDSQIIYNKVYNIGISEAALSVGYGNNIIVANNFINDSGDDGLEFDSTTTNAFCGEVYNNTVSYVGINPGGLGPALYLEGNFPDSCQVNIYNNTFSNSVYGVYATLGDGRPWNRNNSLRIWNNNIFDNSEFGVFVHASSHPERPWELFNNNLGNYWGHSCPDPLFEAGVDSNSGNLTDNYPYDKADRWLTGSPGCTPISCGDAIANSLNLTGNLDCSGGGGGLTLSANNIILDCAGYSILGNGGGNGIYSEKDNVTIKNCTINGFSTGIYFPAGTGNNIFNNTITGNGNYGIKMENTQFDNIASNNVSSNPGSGIYLVSSSFNNFTLNTIQGNNNDGIQLEKSSYAILSNNTITNNNQGVYITGGDPGGSRNDTLRYNKIYNNSNNDLTGCGACEGHNFTGNYWGGYLCNAKIHSSVDINTLLPFYTDPAMMTPDSGPLDCICGTTITENKTLAHDYTCSGNGIILNASNIILNCNGHTITGASSGIGLKFNGVSGATIKNCDISKFDQGILSGNTPTSNNYILNNTVHNNDQYDIAIRQANNYTIAYNNVRNSDIGIRISYSSGDQVYNNTITNNTGSSGHGISIVAGSSENTIRNNTLRLNNIGIEIYAADSNIIESNTIEDNNEDNEDYCGVGISIEGADGDFSENNTIKGNTIKNHIEGEYCYGTGIGIGSENAGNNITGSYLYNNTYGIGINGDNNIIGNNNISSSWINGISGNGIGTKWYITERNVMTDSNVIIKGSINISGNGVLELINSQLTYNGAPITNNGNLTSIPDACGATVSSSRTLVNNISMGTAGDCLTIDANNVVLDCDGHSITGDNVTNTLGYGVYANGYTNITVKNCVIKDFSAGINLNGAFNSLVTNNTISNNGYEPGAMSGIYLSNTGYATVSSNHFFDNDVGVHLSSCDNTNVSSNVIENNNFALSSWPTGYGIWNEGSTNTKAYNNNITGNNNYGIRNSGSIFVYNNRITGNGKGIEGYDSNPVYWTINDNALCKNNNIIIPDGNITFDGGTLELNNCTIFLNGAEVNREGNITSLDQTEEAIEAGTPEELNFTSSDSRITLNLGDNVTTTITVWPESPNASGITATLTALKGIDIIVDNSTSGNLTWALIKIFYNESELTAANIDESTLRIYYYNVTSADWIKYDSPNGGVDTTNNYVWANVTHFSLFGAFGTAPVAAIAAAPTGGANGGCLSNWTCSEWSKCTNGAQTRTCQNLKEGCYSTTKPEETQACSVKGVTGGVTGTEDKNKPIVHALTSTGWWTLVLIIIVISVVVLIILKLTKRKYNTYNTSYFTNNRFEDED